MTFIPSVLSKIDSANSSSTPTSSFTTVTYTSTTGYNNIQLSIKPTDTTVITTCNITITFSNNGTASSYTLTDNFSLGNFDKKYKILDSYYKISITSTSDVTIQSRLLTDTYLSDTNSINSTNNNEEYKIDAFGKLRVTEPTTILDLKFPVVSPTGSGGTPAFLSNNQQICFKSSLSGTSATYSNAKLVVTVSGTTNNSYYISQSRNYCIYQPGKSLLFMCSGIINGSLNGANIYTRIGYFDNVYPITSVPSVYNGLYFEYNNGISVNYTNNGGTPNNTPQTDWNVDKFDGTGTSGINLDFSKALLFVIDLEWLSVGKIRFGFYLYGKIMYCHIITNINELTGPYITQINLPVCYSIHSTSTATGSLTQICASVISEGGYSPFGKPFSINSYIGTSPTGISLSGETIILALRGGSTAGNYYHQSIIPKSIDIVDSGNNNVIIYRLRIYKDNDNFTSSTISWADVNTSYSITQYYTPLTTPYPIFLTGNSIILSEGLFSGKGNVSFGDLSSVFNSSIISITSNISNESDILVLTCELISGTSASVNATISWNEYY